jgi:hypothetical protein
MRDHIEQNRKLEEQESIVNHLIKNNIFKEVKNPHPYHKNAKPHSYVTTTDTKYRDLFDLKYCKDDE